MYTSIKRVSPKENYRLLVEFDNSESRILDMEPYLDFGRFKELKDTEVFKKVKVAFDTVEWDIGLDLDPEFVYEKSVKG